MFGFGAQPSTTPETVEALFVEEYKKLKETVKDLEKCVQSLSWDKFELENDLERVRLEIAEEKGIVDLHKPVTLYSLNMWHEQDFAICMDKNADTLNQIEALLAIEDPSNLVRTASTTKLNAIKGPLLSIEEVPVQYSLKLEDGTIAYYDPNVYKYSFIPVSNEPNLHGMCNCSRELVEAFAYNQLMTQLMYAKRILEEAVADEPYVEDNSQ